MSDEEKKAIGQCRLLLNGDITLHIIDDDGGTAYCGIVNKEYNKDLETVLNLIEKQSKEIEHQKEKRANQRQELAILNAKQIEFNKLVNTVNSYKGQFKRQQKEIEELKEENEKYKNPPFFDEDNYTENDKIKAKIEEINKEMLNEENSLELFYRKKYCKEILQSLLEKE